MTPQPALKPRKSTGPVTGQGKQRASLNAVSHGLTGNRLVLQTHEAEAYARLTQALTSELSPATESERQFVQKIIDCHFRLNRIAALESNLLNFGMVENTLPTAHSDEVESMAAQARSWTANDTSFEKLGRYEARISRQLLQYTKELERLQQARRAAAEAQAEADAEARYLRHRQERMQARQPQPPAALDPELASFCSEARSGPPSGGNRSALMPESAL